MEPKLMICPRCWNVTKPCDYCENRGKKADSQLSKNFWLSELLYSPTAVDKRIANDPHPLHLTRLAEACQNLFQPVRDGIGPMKVTSGYRSQILNQSIKGAKDSAHMAGWAMDSQPQQVSLHEAMIWISKSNLAFDQAILELGKNHEKTSDDWLHLGWKQPTTQQQRRQLLVMENGSYRPWKP